MSDKNKIELEDVQGLVRFGHGRLRSGNFLLLKIENADAARQWLGKTEPTSAETVTVLPDHAMQVALTAQGLRKTGLDEQALAQFSEEFLAGMTGDNRSRRLGDTDNNAPKNWQWGGNTNTLPDVLLMLYAITPEILSQMQEAYFADMLFTQAFSVMQILPCNTQVEFEPFGFADGISQPAIDWERKQTADVHRRDTYSNLLSLGEVLLGHPNEYGEYTDRPLLNTEQYVNASLLPEAEENPSLRDFGKNGSYLVMRQLEQDVPAFWQFVDQAAGNDAARRMQLAEAMVGRKRDGSPLVQLSPQVIEGIPESNQARNNFNFDQDPQGLVCPVASHVRRSNPRTGDFPPGVTGIITRLIRILGFSRKSRELDLIASTRFHRILRRGRQYGPVMTPDEAVNAGTNDSGSRGLHFVCLAANILRQFEFVQNAWVMNPKFGGLQSESDPSLGTGKPLPGGTSTDNFSEPQRSGIRHCTSGIPQFVTVKGGAYFFLPGLRALRYLASLSSSAANTTSSEEQP